MQVRRDRGEKCLLFSPLFYFLFGVRTPNFFLIDRLTEPVTSIGNTRFFRESEWNFLIFLFFKTKKYNYFMY